MTRWMLVLVFLLGSVPAFAQAATVAYDYPVVAGVPLAATVQAWTPTLYVNGTAFVLTHTCTGTTTVTCTATLPNITSALTPTGPQTFTVSLKDTVLGESPQSLPLVKVRPVAPLVLRIQ